MAKHRERRTVLDVEDTRSTSIPSGRYLLSGTEYGSRSLLFNDEVFHQILYINKSKRPFGRLPSVTAHIRGYNRSQRQYHVAWYEECFGLNFQRAEMANSPWTNRKLELDENESSIANDYYSIEELWSSSLPTAIAKRTLDVNKQNTRSHLPRRHV